MKWLRVSAALVLAISFAGMAPAPDEETGKPTDTGCVPVDLVLQQQDVLPDAEDGQAEESAGEDEAEVPGEPAGEAETEPEPAPEEDGQAGGVVEPDADAQTNGVPGAPPGALDEGLVPIEELPEGNCQYTVQIPAEVGFGDLVQHSGTHEVTAPVGATYLDRDCRLLVRLRTENGFALVGSGGRLGYTVNGANGPVNSGNDIVAAFEAAGSTQLSLQLDTGEIDGAGELQDILIFTFDLTHTAG